MKKKTKKIIIGSSVFAFIAASVIGLAHFLINGIELENKQNEFLQELENNKGTYDEKSIVLQNTSLGRAKELSERFNAKLRITNNYEFATLTLPEDTTIVDIVKDNDNKQILDELTIDYQAKVSSDEAYEKYQPLKPNYTVSDEYYFSQTYLDYINIGDAWSQSSSKGSNITIAVIDTGIDTDHEEFQGRISEYSYNATEDKIIKDYLLEDGTYDYSLIEDEVGHGTAVSGVIGASMNTKGITGILPNVTILTIKAECSSNGTFYRSSDLVFGLYYAIERDVNVVNMSFGGSINIYKEPAKLAVDSDIILVAASGNESTSSLTYPAADINVIGVGALKEDSYELADYSNYGENNNLVAPGTVYTTLKDGEYGVMSGTSFSSPVVAASIGLYLSNNKYQTFEDVTERLYASTKDIGSLGQDWLYGYGLLDVNALIVEEVGTVTFNMLTEELDNTEQVFIRNHTLQNLPEPERLYSVFDGWYYDIHCTQELNWYEDVFSSDLTLYAKWVNEDDGVPYTYVELEDETIEIRSYTGHRRFITIPDKIKGKEVSSIGEGAFSNENRLRLVNLPSSLKQIKRSAFENCNNLIHIKLPDTVEYIGQNAFKDNIRLAYIENSENSNLKTISESAFRNCLSLTRFNITKKVEEVSALSFLGSTSIREYNVNKKNTYYSSKEGVLFNKAKDTLIAYPIGLNGEYEIPSKVTTIDSYAFAYSKIKNVDLSNVTHIKEGAFTNSSLEKIDIKDNVVSVSEYAFYNCTALSQVTIGKGLTSLNNGLFAHCSNLKEITIPNNIIDIEIQAFYNSGLEQVTFEENSNLLIIGSSAFSNSALRTIALPDSLINIGDSAFSSCTYLEEVTFTENSNLQVIGAEAFSNTYSLSSFTLPNSLISLGDYAFLESSIEGSVTLPLSLEYFGKGAFASCHNLENIYVDDENSKFLDIDGVVYNDSKTELVEYPAGKTDTSYTIESTVEKVGDSAFYGSHNLIQINLPSNLKVVGEYSFYDVKNISSYTLPNTLESIERYAFAFNTSLRTLRIPDNVTQISNYAFYYDYNLYSISFNDTSKIDRLSYAAFAYTGITTFRVPSNVSTMAQYVFEGCEDLSSITFAKNSKLDNISAYMFIGCDNLQTITFEEGSKLTNIQAHAFEGMRKLRTINFNDAKITNIDNFAFRYCERLQSITLPDTLLSIGRYAFYNCKTLSEITIPTSTEYIGENAFYNTNNINVYFNSDILPFYLQENWDNGIGGYYLSTKEVVVNGDFEYTVMNNGGIALIKYNGTETNLDLNNLNLGGDIISIGGYAFYRSTVQSITLPNTLTSIQRYAFAYSNIKEIIIPNDVAFIGQYAFFNSDIEVVTFEDNSSVYTIEQYAFSELDNLRNIELPNSLVNLGKYAFANSNLETLTFEENSIIETIPECAFMGTNIVEVILPDSVKLINNSAFRDNMSLLNVVFGDNELQIMSNAFYNTGLVSVNINENITYIGEYAFVGLKNLTSFVVSENNPYYSAIDGALYNKEGSKIIAYPANRSGVISLPESLEEIGFGAFENINASKVIFHENSNILSIGYRAFFNASKLEEINIPASVVAIDYYAFAYCSSLRTVIFAENNKLAGVYEGAFYGCTSLVNITLPDTIKEISDFAFYGCRSLKKLPLNETSELLGIYDYAFAYSGIESLELPITLIDIGDYAFKGTKLREVTIPDANKEQLILGIGIFEECNKLETITVPFIGATFEDPDITWFGYIFGAGSYEVNNSYIPSSLNTVTINDGITKIGVGAFYEVTNIEQVIIPNSVYKIYENSFYNSTFKYELTNTISIYDRYGNVENYLSYHYVGKGIKGNLIIAEGVISIEGSAFRGCSSLTSIVIPESVTSIGENAFWNCSSLTSIVIPEGVTSIGNCIFRYCGSLKSVVIPEGVTSIGSYAFEGCSSLTSIEIPEGVTSIGYRAFKGCSSLESITLSSTIASVEQNAFEGCSSLEDVYYKGTIENWCKILFSSDAFGNYSYSNPVHYADNFYMLDKNNEWYKPTEIEIPNTITIIGEHQFCGFNQLISVIIPESVTSIGYRAFKGCSSLTSVVIPEGVTSIGSYAFYGCSSLTSIVIPEGVTSIGSYAFYGCSCLTSVTFEEGSKLISIGWYAFYGCSSLTSINIPEGVTSIGGYTFEGCNNLINIKLPNNLTSIGEYAFWNCISLTSIVIPEGVTSIGDSAFRGCSSLTKVYNNSSLNITIGSTDNGHIGYYAYLIYNKDGSIQYKDSSSIITEEGFIFKYDSEYILYAYIGDEETITLPESINGEFYRIRFETLKAKNVIIPESVTSIGDYAFRGCSSLTSIVIPEGVTSIGDYAFRGCSSLTSIVIPEGVTSIGREAFSECRNLISIELSDTLTSIGYWAFSNCSSLQFNVYNNGYYLGNEENPYLYLHNVDDDINSIVINENAKFVNSDAFDNVAKLKSVELPSEFLSYIPKNNLETIILTDINNYWELYISQPLTLKNIVLGKGVEINYSSLFKNFTNINIFVVEDKNNVMWDYDYPNWNNGNKVYYAGEWITASFYNENKELISKDYYSINEMIRQPYYELREDKLGEYSFIGWDTNNDGVADFIPATSKSNIEAYAVIVNETQKYTVSYFDYDNTLIESIELPYGSLVELIDSPERLGYEFIGWDGYYEGITVTSNISFYAQYEHIGGEHSYSKETIDPTCEHEGYDLYRCDICHEEYKDNFVDKVDHSYGDYIIDKVATCQEEGHKYRECNICGHKDEVVIEANEHQYEKTIIEESTCTKHGIVEYRCNICNEVYQEELHLEEHQYSKKYVSKSLIRIIIEYLLNIIYGYEGDQAYYYECEVCGKKLEKGESTSIFSVSSNNNCEHSDCYWILDINPTCEEQGLEVYKCNDCDEVVDFRFINSLGHTYSTWNEEVSATCIEDGVVGHYHCEICGANFDSNYNILDSIVIPAYGHSYTSEVTEPTCEEQGYTTYTCKHCGDSYIDNYVEATGHTYGAWEVVTKATCENDGLEHRFCHCGHEETRVIKAHGHSYVWNEEVSETCIEDGVVGHYHCETCGSNFDSNYNKLDSIVIPAHGHSYTSEITEPTCEEQGYTTYTCEHCGDTYISDYVAALGHDMLVDQDGNSSCSRCDYQDNNEKTSDTLPVDRKIIIIGIALGVGGISLLFIFFKKRY